jgi:hypothetical protein
MAQKAGAELSKTLLGGSSPSALLVINWHVKNRIAPVSRNPAKQST